MTGPHPAVAAVRLAVRRGLAELGDLAPERPLTVACSGGADSVALAAAAVFEGDRLGQAVGATVVDHGLQPGSAAVAGRTAGLLFELGLTPVTVVAVDVGIAGGPEAAARSARYAALSRAPGPVLLGHTRDDQAETVLLGLGRGSGPRSIAGMRAVDGQWVRPLLGVARGTTHTACAALGLPVWHDPHNDDPRFRRVRLRTELLPLLEDVLAGGVAAALARTADLLRADVDALDALANDWLAAHGTGCTALPVVPLLAMPRALRSRVLRQWISGDGVALGAVHLDAIDALCTDWHGQAPLNLPAGTTIARRSGRLHLNRPDPSAGSGIDQTATDQPAPR